MSRNMEETFSELFNRTVEFNNYRLLHYEKGRIEAETIVDPSDANPYGFAHGGYLFTLCDDMAGLLGHSLGSYVATQQASISYLASARSDDVLHIKAFCLHDGRSSKVAEVSVFDQHEKLICKATFTLFPMRNVQEKDQ